MRIVAFAGLPGTGKSTLARALGARLGAPVIDKDRFRDALFGAEVDYSSEQNAASVRAMHASVEALAEARCECVILDGRTYTRREHVTELRELATRLRAELVLVECACDASVARARIAADVRAGAHLAADRTPELYDEIARRAEPLDGERIVLRTDFGDVQALVEALVVRLRA